MIGEFIDMYNENSFVTLAFIRENDNPYEIFCKFIEYCLYKEEQLTYENLINKLKEEFGLNIPYHVYNSCLGILQSNEIIIKLKNGFGYKIHKLSINVKDFENQRKILQVQEQSLINDLICYAKDVFDRDWGYDSARDNLRNFLTIDDNASSIFINDITNNTYDKMSEEWITQNYIQHLINEKNEFYLYMIDLTKGLMIYIGTFYSDLNQIDIDINNTDFYLDTKLVLRLLGYTTEIYNEAVNQLVEMICDKYKGNICVFEHTVGEVKSALYNAMKSLSKNEEIEDNELRYYRYLENKDEDDLKVDYESVEYELTEIHHIRIQEPIKWENKDIWIDSIGEKELYAEIEKYRNPEKEVSISNDVKALNQINMLRKSDYSIHFGGKNRLPIIVTNNTLLIKCVKNFIRKDIKSNDESIWSLNKIPIISDSSLMCKLWVNISDRSLDLPKMLFAQNAYAILPYDDAFYKHLRDKSKVFRDKYNYKIFNVSNERLSKIEKEIIKTNKGDFENYDDEQIIFTLEETYMVEKKQLNEEINEKDNKIKNQEKIISDKDIEISSKNELLKHQEKQIIEAYSLHHLDNLGINMLILLLGKSWWILSTIVFAIISYIGFPKSEITSEISPIVKILITSIPILSIVGLEIIKKYLRKKRM